MKYDFVSVGDVTTDSFIKLKDGIHIDSAHDGHEKAVCLNFGDKVEYEDVTIVHGVGNAGNAAVSAQRLGLNAALATDIGTDEGGNKCIVAWEADGLSREFVRRHKEFPTQHHFVLRYGPERTILIKHQKYPYAVPDFPEPPRWIYFSSVGEHGLAYHHELAAYVKESGIKLAFQPGSFQISLGTNKIKDVYEAAEIFFCNKQEAQRILENSEDDFKKLLDGVRSLGPNIAVVTDGPGGAYASDGKEYWRMPMYPDPAPPVDRTGAGDAFASTVVSFLALGESLEVALERGPINSMSVVQYVGAQKGLLSREQIEQFLKSAPADYKLTKIA